MEAVTGAALRAVMGQLVTGVCVVTATHDGHDVAMTASSVTSVSLEPPLVLVCVAHAARFHDPLLASPAWGVSTLAAGAQEVSRRLAEAAPVAGQLAGVGLHRGPVTGVALLQDSCATLECRTEDVFPGGDHSIVVGRVVGTGVPQPPRDPLVHHRGGYTGLS